MGKILMEISRKSQVDVCLVNTNGLDAVTSFNIHHVPINFSDHKPISVELNFEINSTIPTSQVTADILSNNGEDAGKKPPSGNQVTNKDQLGSICRYSN